MKVLLLLLYSAALLGADRILLSPLWRELQATKYPTVEGRVVARQPFPQYEYSVAGRTYRGTQLRYSTFGRATHPELTYKVGDIVSVRFPQENPLESALEAGWNGSDLMLFMFMVPWNTLALSGWLRLPGGPGFRIWRGGPNLGTRLFRALNAALITTTIGVLMAFALILAGEGLNPHPVIPIAGFAITLPFVLAGSLSAWRQPLREGIVLHEDGFTLYTQGQPRRLSYELVQEVRAEADGRIVLDYSGETLTVTRAEKWLPVLRAKLLRADCQSTPTAETAAASPPARR